MFFLFAVPAVSLGPSAMKKKGGNVNGEDLRTNWEEVRKKMESLVVFSLIDPKG